MKRQILLLACAGLLAQTLPAQQVNDVNTPLHLLKPDYGFHYGIPAKDDVKATLDRVTGFLEAQLPAEVVDGKPKQGGFRLTSYECGVLYAAMEDAYKRTGDERYLRFVETRLQMLADLLPAVKAAKQKTSDPQLRPMAYPGALDDAGAMCSAYCRLALDRPYGGYEAVIKNYMAQIWRQYRIGDDKIFARIRPHHNSVWLDDMYMGIPPLAWYGCLNDDAASLREAVAQIRAFERRMWVPEQRLFRHGWIEEMTPHPMFPWARANGWALLTMTEVLDAMERHHERSAAAGKADYADYAADRDYILGLLRQHVEGLTALQDKTGLWHQLLTDPQTYLESSATAIYTYCLAHAICEGWIDAEAYGAQTFLGWNALATQVNAQGQVENTCVGTGMGFDRAFYAYRPVHVMALHGYGPTVWAAAEILRMLEVTHPKMNDSALHFYPTEQKTSKPIFSEVR